MSFSMTSCFSLYLVVFPFPDISATSRTTSDIQQVVGLGREMGERDQLIEHKYLL